MVRNSDEVSDKTDRIQMRINSLKVSKCAPEENLLSSSHRAQDSENQTEILIMELAELQWKFKS